MIADDTVHKNRRVKIQEPLALTNCVTFVYSTNIGSASSADPLADTLKNADKALVPDSVCYMSACFANTLQLSQPAPTTLGKQA